MCSFTCLLGEPLAGWVGTLAVAASFVATVAVFADLVSKPAGERGVNGGCPSLPSTPTSILPRLSSSASMPPARRPATR